MIIEASFDPITSAAITEIRKIQKTEGIRDIYVQVSDVGIASKHDRTQMLKLAFGRFRHIHVTSDQLPDRVLTEPNDDEYRTRCGYFRLVPACVRHYLIENNIYLPQIV